jgi:hypothetical protein
MGDFSRTPDRELRGLFYVGIRTVQAIVVMVRKCEMGTDSTAAGTEEAGKHSSESPTCSSPTTVPPASSRPGQLGWTCPFRPAR